MTPKEIQALRDSGLRFFIEETQDPNEHRGWQITDRTTGQSVGWDGGEPEDQTLVRDWEWVVHALNILDAENKAKK